VSNMPHVAIVIDDSGEVVREPLLHQTAKGGGIQAALAASSVHLQLNHHLVLQLSARVGQLEV
jgi:hypothetical protein